MELKSKQLDKVELPINTDQIRCSRNKTLKRPKQHLPGLLALFGEV